MQEEKDSPPEQKKEEPKLHVDEDWKQSVAEEKQTLRDEEEGRKRGQSAEKQKHPTFPEPSIEIFMAGLYTQTLIALGALENPATRNSEKNITEAAYLIDTMKMLQEKTEGNLTPEESSYVQNILYDLQMRYVSAAEQEDDTQQDARQTEQG